MQILYVEINGKQYKLQHPGAGAYFRKKKELNQITKDGFIQWDEAALFDFCFGTSKNGNRCVFTSNGDFLNWRKAGITEGENIPSLKELSEGWASILPLFLSQAEKTEPDEDSVFKWIDHPNDGSTTTNKTNTSNNTK